MIIERINSYNEAVSYILEIPRFSAKNEETSTREFLELVGEGKIDTVIHVAGTNGKGSTCAFLNAVFMKIRKKTGMFTSPHLVDIRERIQIDGKMISEEAFLECTNYIIDKINVIRGKNSEYHPSFFEFVFFIAVKYFSDNGIDVAIYETGLGGRLDATNSLSKKDVCIITEVGMDHMEYLGDTFEKIAYEKAGIISDGVPVVYWNEREECSSVIENRAKECNALAYSVGKESAKILKRNDKSIDFSYKSIYDNDIIFTVRSYAQYQVYNAAMALKTLEILGIDVESEEVINGISDMHWPGRMEQIDAGIFADGGHNVDGVQAFIESVINDGCKGKRHLLYSAVSDKQVDVISRMLVECNAFDRFALCEINSGRAKKIEELKRIFDTLLLDKGEHQELISYDDVKTALSEERGLIGADDRLYICGSLYLVGAVKEYIEAIKHD